MKPTGRKNPITGEEVMQAEESDCDFTKKWEDLSLEEKATFLSLIKTGYLNKQNEPIVKQWWEYYQKKHA